METKPKEITICNLEVLLMPNGEIICLGKTLGWFESTEKEKGFKKYLSPKIKKENILKQKIVELLEKSQPVQCGETFGNEELADQILRVVEKDLEEKYLALKEI